MIKAHQQALEAVYDGLLREVTRAERQRARLERLASRLAKLDLETSVGAELSLQALCRLATLVREARAQEVRLRRDALRIKQIGGLSGSTLTLVLD